MNVFINAWFERFARKHKIEDQHLLEAVRQAERGQIDADLGGGVLKQRVARTGQGKSTSFRTVILYRKHARAVFVFGFSKSDRANLTLAEKVQFKKAAKHVLGLTDQQLAELVRTGYFSEVGDDNGEDVPK